MMAICRPWPHKIPFLLIESATTEYRTTKALKNHPDPTIPDLARSLRIYTLRQ